ncbi:MAG: hypothetical protein HOE90_06045 [Bacteriovoracaceae bacterium]|jgi:hypothetical protein|nr:hypothetical protein [Bacteriovoracaceae bacterium]
MRTLILTCLLITGAYAQDPSFEQSIPTIEDLRIDSVEKVISGKVSDVTGIPFTTIKVYGQSTFSNSCVTPDSFAKKVERKPFHNSYHVFAITHNRICPMVYRPVTKRFLIDTIHTFDTIPLITVNGVDY